MKKHLLQGSRAILMVAVLAVAPAFAQSTVGLKDAGVGQHTGASTVYQVASFTLNSNMVMCSVGTLDVNGTTGPFNMLMFELSSNSYTVDRKALTINATGTMRSITQIAGVTVEDTDGVGSDPQPVNFIAIGHDNKDQLIPSADFFELHFKSPLWNTSNPLCTASNLISGGCVFEGPLSLGRIHVNPS
jgi:hypothetical protein